MSETKILERCPKCDQAVKLEVTWFGITRVIPCYCDCENEDLAINAVGRKPLTAKEEVTS